MIKKIIPLLLFICLVLPLFSQEIIVIKEISGKVEIKAPGKGWEVAKNGMNISKGTTISTGFKSKATLDLGTSVIYVKQLTRMQIEELLEQEKTVTTKLNLRVGDITAEVKSTQNLAHDFKLKSSVSTAAVRGTKFDYTRLMIDVANGIVDFINQLNQSRGISGGERSRIAGNNLPAMGEFMKKLNSEVSPYTLTAEGTPGITPPGQLVTGNIIVSWD